MKPHIGGASFVHPSLETVMNLSGKRIAMLIEQQYQEMEVWYPVYRLKEAGAALDAIGGSVGKDDVAKLQGLIDAAAIKAAPQRSTIAPRFGQLADTLAEYSTRFSKPGRNNSRPIWDCGCSFAGRSCIVR